MVSIWSGLRCKTPLEDSYPRPAIMIDTDTLQQLQTCIVEMERCHEEELRKLKTDYDQLKDRYGELPPRSIDSFDILVERFNAQYATSRSHRMTLATLASLR
ncbi:hypothetical protein GmHk_19G054784 [Glycine max]|nr:hypothetical protein GmHk_19G054784 [Glycine max]